MSNDNLPGFRAIDPLKSGPKTAEMLPSVEAAALGLKRYKTIGRKGPLAIVLTQAMNPETLKEEPAMLLANTRDPVNRHAFVLLSQLFQAVDVGAAREVVRAARELAPRLFGFVTKYDVDLICDALLEFGEDLQKALPAKQLGTQDWLAALAQDGFTIRHDGKAVN
ncbi:hypothetical protein [Luteimonas saliphila]|uniref:hypothetical protein n=1 Tax=Luteimonas saliphila TaxID=2804919 RepID=UPI00192DA340|nr:hypothetical protein [Luteimonas saliphila]